MNQSWVKSIDNIDRGKKEETNSSTKKTMLRKQILSSNEGIICSADENYCN